MPQGPFYLVSACGTASAEFTQVGRYGLRTEVVQPRHLGGRKQVVLETEDGPALRNRLCRMFPSEDQSEDESEREIGAACPNAEDSW